jgi:glycosyltransferase involved in cell wall biosynthesis
LQRMAQHPGIHFGGRIERDNLWRVLLEEAHAGIVPTLWYETASLVIQEFFAARVPVIGSRIGVLPGRIRDGVDGLLFTPGDATALRAILQRLLDEPALLSHLRANIRPPRLMADHVKDVSEVYGVIKTENWELEIRD